MRRTRTGHEIPRFPARRPRLARLGLVALAVGAAVPGTAAARSTLLDDDAATIQRIVADRPDGTPGLRVLDGLYQATTTPPVLPRGRRVPRVLSVAGPPGVPSLVGRGAAGMAAILGSQILASRSGRVLVDELGPEFRGSQGDDLAAALAILARDGLARGVNFTVPNTAAFLTDPAWSGARLAAVRAGGVWLATTRWSSAGWLTWPSEVALRFASGGSARNRVHVSIGAGDQAAIWNRARSGSACGVLANGPGGTGLGASVDGFVTQFRRTFPAIDDAKSPAAGCTAVNTLSDRAARALNGAALDEGSGLEIPLGGLVTPPLQAGQPAQVSVQLGADPLGLAAALGVSSEDFWQAARAVVTARGAGVAAEAEVTGDGSVALQFTPTGAGSITLRLVVPGAAFARALGGPTEIVGPLRAVRASSALITQIVASPDAWELDIPLMNPGQTPGSGAIEVIP